jgi:translation elongation factor EF-4
MRVYRLPPNEVVFDFYDRLKSVSRGYASFDHQLDGYAEGDLVLMNILVNGEPVDAKQKDGKKRRRQFGKVEIPQSAFIAALKMGAG